MVRLVMGKMFIAVECQRVMRQTDRETDTATIECNWRTNAALIVLWIREMGGMHLIIIVNATLLGLDINREHT